MPTAMRQQLWAFSQRLSRGQYAPQRRFVFDALRGLHLSGDVMLSSWGRALQEGCALLYTEKRLSNGLKSTRLDDTTLQHHALALTGRLVRQHCTAVSVDTTDVSKKYAKKMPFLAHVHDGSEGTVANGWMVLRADGVAQNGRHVPLHINTFSREAPEYRGDLDALRSFLEAILRYVPRSTPFVFDAGHDGRSYRGAFAELGVQFTCRIHTYDQHLRRVVDSGGAPQTLADLLEHVAVTDRFRITKFTEHAKGAWVAQVGWRPAVRFRDARGQPEARGYGLVVVREHRAGADPMVLLTTDRLRSDADARRVVERYFSRWSVEEGHRLIKMRFGLENLRVLTWRGIKRLVFLAHLAYAFMAWLVYRGPGEALARTARAFGAVPKFLYYRLAQAICTALAIS